MTSNFQINYELLHIYYIILYNVVTIAIFIYCIINKILISYFYNIFTKHINFQLWQHVNIFIVFQVPIQICILKTFFKKIFKYVGRYANHRIQVFLEIL